MLGPAKRTDYRFYRTSEKKYLNTNTSTQTHTTANTNTSTATTIHNNLVRDPPDANSRILSVEEMVRWAAGYFVPAFEITGDFL